MTLDTKLAKIASLMGDPTRSAILLALMAGRALTAGELALRANISPQTASNHLKKLQEAGLIEYIKTPTRYRYYQISSPLVAQALEALSLLTPAAKQRPPHHQHLDKEICFARTCYDHLAGTLGIRLSRFLQKMGYLELTTTEFKVTQAGELYFQSLGMDLTAVKKQKRQFAKACLDWTEREFHIAGALGAALLTYLLEQGLLKLSKKSRVLNITPKGQTWFNDLKS